MPSRALGQRCSWSCIQTLPTLGPCTPKLLLTLPNPARVEATPICNNYSRASLSLHYLLLLPLPWIAGDRDTIKAQNISFWTVRASFGRKLPLFLSTTAPSAGQGRGWFPLQPAWSTLCLLSSDCSRGTLPSAGTEPCKDISARYNKHPPLSWVSSLILTIRGERCIPVMTAEAGKRQPKGTCQLPPC